MRVSGSFVRHLGRHHPATSVHHGLCRGDEELVHYQRYRAWYCWRCVDRLGMSGHLPHQVTHQWYRMREILLVVWSHCVVSRVFESCDPRLFFSFFSKSPEFPNFRLRARFALFIDHIVKMLYLNPIALLSHAASVCLGLKLRVKVWWALRNTIPSDWALRAINLFVKIRIWWERCYQNVICIQKKNGNL